MKFSHAENKGREKSRLFRCTSIFTALLLRLYLILIRDSAARKEEREETSSSWTWKRLFNFTFSPKGNTAVHSRSTRNKYPRAMKWWGIDHHETYLILLFCWRQKSRPNEILKWVFSPVSYNFAEQKMVGKRHKKEAPRLLKCQSLNFTNHRHSLFDWDRQVDQKVVSTKVVLMQMRLPLTGTP